MSGAIFMMMAAGGIAEQPIDGQTGVWLKSGDVTLSRGMKMTGAVVSSGRKQFVYSKGEARYTQCLGVGDVLVSNGGVASNCCISGLSNKGRLLVYAGGTAVSCVLQSGEIHVNGYPSAATLVDAVAHGGPVRFQNYANVSNFTISGGTLNAGEGGAPKRIYGMNVCGGVANIYGNTVLSGAAVHVGRVLHVSSGGLLCSGTISGTSALADVSSGGSASAITIQSGGRVNIWPGGNASDIATDSGTLVLYGGTAGNINHNGGTFIVQAGAVAEGLITYAGAFVVIGKIYALTVNGNKSPQISGYCSGATVTSNGCLQTMPGGTIANVTVESGCSLYVHADGSALAVTSNAGAVVSVFAGGYIEYVNVGPVDGSAGVFLRSAGSTVSSAMSMTEPVIISSGYQLDVYSGGTVLSAEWQRGGTPHVYSGGSVDHMLVSNQSTATEHCYIDLGGRVEDISIVNTNSRYLHGPGSIGSLTLMSGVVFASSASIGTLTQSTYGGLRALEGTTISNALISANHLHISPGAFVSSATVFTGGNMSVYSGGTALNVRNSGGNIVVKDGGYIEYVTP